VVNPIPNQKVLPRRPSKKKLISERNAVKNLARRPSSKNISNSYMSRYKSQKQIRKVYSKREISSGKKKDNYLKPEYGMKRVRSSVKKKERTRSKERKTSKDKKVSIERRASKDYKSSRERKSSKDRKFSKEKRTSIGSKRTSSEKQPVVLRKPKPVARRPCKNLILDIAPRRQSSQKSINKKPTTGLSRRKSADRLVTKPKQPPTRQRKSIRKSASNLHSHKGVAKQRLPPKKQTRESFTKAYQNDTNSKKKAIPKRVKSNRVVNYLSHKSSAKDLHSRPNYSKYNYQSNVPEPVNNEGTQSSINNNSRPIFLPPKLQKDKPTSKYISHNPQRSKHIPPMPNNPSKYEMKRNSSKGKYNSQKSGKMLHYQEYMRKMQENKMRRKKSQNKLVTRGQANDEQRVYRSRVSSAEVQRDSASRYNKLYGYKPLWYG
jgi:hypothetical protein